MLVILLLVATAISAGLWLYERDVGTALRGDRDLRRRAAQRAHGLHPGVARGAGGGGACGRCRRRRPTSFATASAQSIPAAELVPGDIILIEEGDTIPADARLIQSTALQTAEAALTGESLPVSKDIAAIRGGGRARRPRTT